MAASNVWLQKEKSTDRVRASGRESSRGSLFFRNALALVYLEYSAAITRTRRRRRRHRRRRLSSSFPPPDSRQTPIFISFLPPPL